MTNQVAMLQPAGEGNIALKKVAIDASLRGLMSEVTVCQTYRNLEQKNIEAVYTFPVPLGAVLLDLTLELNGEVLTSDVRPRVKAEAVYEEAISGGDTAVLLTEVQPGLFSVSVGNLMAGEEAVLRYRYAQLHRWQGDDLRFSLPTTLKPRYGSPAAAGLMPFEVPSYTIDSNVDFSVAVAIHGELAQADIECPTHTVLLERGPDCMWLRLGAGSAPMDRDFVAVIRKPQEFEGQGLWAPDADGVVALASFHPQAPEIQDAETRCIKLVVDCSGSMAGVSIEQAKLALREILDLLRPTDMFTLTLFGTQYQMLANQPLYATEANIARAARLVQRLDADFGGTEMASALKATYACGAGLDMPKDVLLITDGAVYDHDTLVEAATNSGHRLFTVGVGSAVSEALLQRMAAACGGSCELVSPGENMAQHIVRHFRKINHPAFTRCHVIWPDTASQQHPEPLGKVYGGDTVHVFGWLAHSPRDKVTLEMHRHDIHVSDAVVCQPVANSDDQGVRHVVLARVAAHSRLTSLDAVDAGALAVEYQLVSRYTSCVLVKERVARDKAQEIPKYRGVPHLIPASTFGAPRAAGMVRASEVAVAGFEQPHRPESGSSRLDKTYFLDLFSEPAESAGTSPGSKADEWSAVGDGASAASLAGSAADESSAADRVGFRFRLANTDGWQTKTPAERFQLLKTANVLVFLKSPHIEDVKWLGEDESVLEVLRELVEQGVSENRIVLAWLSLLIADSEAGVGRIKRVAVYQQCRRNKVDKDLKDRLAEAIGAVVSH